ncbi:MAG: hypothetical protein K2Q14_04595, partial [Gammaproteobacteria bacterium]|nr:hypothetical protein [Gammaproteobacteria bacterium]MBY0544810.1 hypothetical protein [Gammaproteobacteria bacterium]
MPQWQIVRAIGQLPLNMNGMQLSESCWSESLLSYTLALQCGARGLPANVLPQPVNTLLQWAKQALENSDRDTFVTLLWNALRQEPACATQIAQLLLCFQEKHKISALNDSIESQELLRTM